MIATYKGRAGRKREIVLSGPLRSLRPLREEQFSAGRSMHALATELFPICRSITGAGLRSTLRRIQQEVPITIHEVPSGTPVLDWTVPDEWNIREAWVANANGERVVDFARNNLHVVNYSTPIRARKSLGELRPHLHTLPERPDWIPYRTSYYKRQWGFCLPHRQLQQLEDGDYDVCIDSTLAPGSLSYGELLIRGELEDEFLISAHCCHPSLANDNLSGVVVAVALAQMLANPQLSPLTQPLRHSYRFLFVPGTIGAITWLARNENRVERIKAGLVLTCVGDRGAFTYKKSRRGDACIDLAMAQVLRESGVPHRIIDFFPYGYDERQYCSPGFNLPVGCLMRSQHGTFPEYHTSADDLRFISREALAESLETILKVIDAFERENDAPSREHRITSHSGPAADGPRFLNLRPKGEPHLAKYNMGTMLGADMMPALWVLNLSDGLHSLADIAAKSSLPFDNLAHAADILCTHGLLKEVEP